MTLVDNGFRSTFTASELQRLRAYKGAVAARLYSDWDGSAEATDCETLALLMQPLVATSEASSSPFTLAERRRLEACRSAVAAGYYAEDIAN